MLKDAFSFVLQGINCEKNYHVLLQHHNYSQRVALLLMQSWLNIEPVLPLQMLISCKAM